MFGRFTQRAQMAIAQARREAAALQHTNVGTEFLLLGLLRDSDNLAPEVEAHVDPDKVIEQIRATADGSSLPERPRFDMTPRMKKAIDQAIAESHRHGQNYVTSEHLWLALLADRECQAAAILSYLGVDFDRLRAQLEDQLRSGEPEARKREDDDEEEVQQNAPMGSPAPGFRPNPENRGRKNSALRQYTRDLTASAEKNELDPVIGRDTEIQRVIQILIRRTKNNPVLIG
ncbi:MAG: ATP-dependent Clp protease ATP-binding subunit, partial [Clostridia bacterium]|nr:ATP-dependent Clp protease ATP-binding subunit [Clostridia bacterium]